MDQFGAKNVRIVLLTVVGLVAVFSVAIVYLSVRHEAVPDLLSNGFTVLLGILTGSAVSLSAKPKVGGAGSQDGPDSYLPALDEPSDGLAAPSALPPLEAQ